MADPYANRRKHAGTRMIPAEALAADRAAMATLPPVAPVTGTTVTTRLGRDYYVSLGRQRVLGAPGGDRPDDHRAGQPG